MLPVTPHPLPSQLLWNDDDDNGCSAVQDQALYQQTETGTEEASDITQAKEHK